MQQKINDFINNSSQTELTFNELLNGKERLAIHEYCEKVGLFSKSEGNGKQKGIIIYKQKPIISSEEKVSDDDRKQFIKDFGLPIPVYKEPYFSYFLETLDTILDTKKKYRLLLDAIENLDQRGKKLKTFTMELSNKIIQQISEQNIYQQFTKDTSKATSKYITKDLPPDVEIYSRNGEFPKVLFSLDIIKANFSSMKFHNPEIVFNCNTWEELIKRYTDIPYFTQAKFFRQIIFNRLSSKGIPIIQKYLLCQLNNNIKSYVNVLGRTGNDELIISSTHLTYKDDLATIDKIMNELPDNNKSIWRVTPFILSPLGKTDIFVKKNLLNGSIEIKHIDKDFYTQAYKYYMNIPLNENDMKAMKDDYLITYDEPYIFE